MNLFFRVAWLVAKILVTVSACTSSSDCCEPVLQRPEARMETAAQLQIGLETHGLQPFEHGRPLLAALLTEMCPRHLDVSHGAAEC